MIPLLLGQVGRIGQNFASGLSNMFLPNIDDEIRQTSTEHNLKSEYIKLSSLNDTQFFNDKGPSLTGVGSAFLASAILATIGHTTSFLDKFGDRFGSLLKYVLDAISLSLGTVTAVGFFSKKNNFDPK